MPEPLRDVIARHGLQATKALGQNFILDRQLLARIAAIPGRSNGRHRLRSRARPRRADARAARRRRARSSRSSATGAASPRWPSSRPTLPASSRSSRATRSKIDERAEAGDGAHIVANLPYNVGTALLLRWLEGPWPPWWSIADPDVPARSRRADRRQAGQRALWPPVDRRPVAFDAAHRAWRSTARLSCPPPKVASAVVHIVPGRGARRRRCRRVLERLTAAAFGQRRKMLRSSLKAVPARSMRWPRLESIQSAGRKRVSVDEFVALARALDA